MSLFNMLKFKYHRIRAIFYIKLSCLVWIKKDGFTFPKDNQWKKNLGHRMTFFDKLINDAQTDPSNTLVLLRLIHTRLFLFYLPFS